MIGKVITGKSFGGCIRYVVQKHDAVILDAAGVRMQQVNQTINDFNLQRKYNPNLGKAVGHIALNWSVKDLDKLNDEVMVNMAKEYLQRMEIQDTQYLIVKHRDKEHPHIHIVYNRVSNNGETIPDKFQKKRNVQVAKELTIKHGFYLSPGKDEVNRQQLKGEDQIKYELFDAIKAASKKVKNINELKQLLAKQGIVTHFKYKSGTTEVQGISFSKGEYKFKGSEIDRSLSYAKLSQAIEQQQAKPEKSLADQLREILNNSEKSREFEMSYLKQAQTYGTELSGGLFVKVADDVDDEAIYGRNRHRKKQAQTNKR
ncbi:hypothetical protein ACVW0P_004459 [Mucilaginibacter sp. UYNi724]